MNTTSCILSDNVGKLGSDSGNSMKGMRTLGEMLVDL